MPLKFQFHVSWNTLLNTLNRAESQNIWHHYPYIKCVTFNLVNKKDIEP